MKGARDAPTLGKPGRLRDPAPGLEAYRRLTFKVSRHFQIRRSISMRSIALTSDVLGRIAADPHDLSRRKGMQPWSALIEGADSANE